MNNNSIIEQYCFTSCPEYVGNICHTLKEKERELEVYKKALNLACTEIYNHTVYRIGCICTNCNYDCIECIKNNFLENAKENK